MAVTLPVNLKTLLDPDRLARARARLHAWWEGEAYDPAAVPGAAKADTAADSTATDDDTAALDPRLLALQTLWGPDRVMPGDPVEEATVPGVIAAPSSGTLAVLGPGLAGPVCAVAQSHQGEIAIREWRDDCREALLAGLRSASLTARARPLPFDLETFAAPAAAWDGVWSVDDFTYAPTPGRFALQVIKGLKPGARGWIEAYCAEDPASVAGGFATAFAEPHLRAPFDVSQALAGAGFDIEDESDRTELHAGLAREGFRRLEQALTEAAAQELAPGVAREIAWEAEAWTHRIAALSDGRLTRWRFLVRRPDDV